tara:strand:+ start:681 stop:1166 length:486 start_codon:yes stop_codon:yes gene_type:complete
MNLKRIKKHFKNANTVRCLDSGRVFSMTIGSIKLSSKSVYYFDAGINTYVIFTIEQGYAEILDYNPKQYKSIKSILKANLSITDTAEEIERFTNKDEVESVNPYNMSASTLNFNEHYEPIKQPANDMVSFIFTIEQIKELGNKPFNIVYDVELQQYVIQEL